MSRAEYPNRNALDQALKLYLDAMYLFVSECLDEQSITEALRLQSSDNLREEMEIKDIADLIKMRWLKSFKEKFKVVDREYTRYYDARSVTSLIIEGRNQLSHQWLRELDPEFTRSQLFLIAEVLGKIKRPDVQREIERIRDELFDDTTEQLVTMAVEAEKAEYNRSISDLERRLAAEKEKNEKLSKEVDSNVAELNKKKGELEKLSGQLVSMRSSEKKNEKQFKSISEQLKKVQTAHSACEGRIASTETERDDYKERFEIVSREREEAETEWQACEDSLEATRNLFTVLTIGNMVFPSFETGSPVRILDRRGVDKKDYLLNLLEQKQPTLIYVQSEEMVELLLERVIPEKADLIEKHGEHTSESEEREILEKLENGEKIAVVSDTAFPTLVSPHRIEHFIFCHLVPGLDTFFKQCEPAFTSEKNAYLHLVYNGEQDAKGLNQWLTQKYPDAETLGKLYRELRDLVEIDGGFIKLENVYDENICNKLGIVKLGVETGLAIFEELQFLERNESGVKVLPNPEKRGLDESEIHCGGEELKHGVAEVQAFQLKQSIEQIWEEIQEKLDVDSEQILREVNTHEMYASTSEMENDQQPTETVENDSETDDEDTDSELAEETSENKPEVKQSEFWQPIRAGEFGELFAGKPVLVRDDGWISKQIRRVEIILSFRKNCSYVSFLCTGENRIERREKIIALFPEADYDYSPRESPQRAGFKFPVIDKGKDHPEDWDEIREKLVAMGTDIYNKIDASAL